MKNIIIILCCLVTGYLSAQDLPSSGFDKVRIVETDRVILAEVKPVNTLPHPKKELFYNWYSANAIHSTQGGFSGKLLNGRYNEYYLNKSLKEQGAYKRGLKTGSWQQWKDDGTLLRQSSWKNGTLLPDTTISFWKKLPFIRKQKKRPEKTEPKN